MKNQSDEVGFFIINPLYKEKMERKKRKINLVRTTDFFFNDEL